MMSKTDVGFVTIGLALLALICIILVLTERIERLEARARRSLEVELSLTKSIQDLAQASTHNSSGITLLSDALIGFTRRTPEAPPDYTPQEPLP